MKMTRADSFSGSKHPTTNTTATTPGEATTTATTTTTTKGLNSEGWKLSPSPGWSCNQVCLAVGLSCSEAEQHAHNADVSSTSGIQSIMNSMGKTCGAVNTQWGIALDVPGIKVNDECFTSSPSRTASEYSCSRAQEHMYRLCYCSSATTSTVNTTGSSKMSL